LGAAPIALPVAAGKLECAGLAVLAFLVAGQCLVQPIRFQVTPGGEAIQTTNTASTVALELHGGRFKLELDKVPMMGSPTAKHVMVSLFDYTCHFCRETHPHLVEVQKEYGENLGIVTLPMPLDSECNHLVSPNRSALNACGYAKLGLAVWAADPGKFREFDEWMFRERAIPALPNATARARELVGSERLEDALNGAWVAEQLKMDIDIYEANSRQMRTGRMPQLIVGDSIVTGPLDSREKLDEIVEKAFGLRAPGIKDSGR
jgi:protein-disulfide isomerase